MGDPGLGFRRTESAADTARQPRPIPAIVRARRGRRWGVWRRWRGGGISWAACRRSSSANVTFRESYVFVA